MRAFLLILCLFVTIGCSWQKSESQVDDGIDDKPKIENDDIANLPPRPRTNPPGDDIVEEQAKPEIVVDEHPTPLSDNPPEEKTTQVTRHHSDVPVEEDAVLRDQSTEVKEKSEQTNDQEEVRGQDNSSVAVEETEQPEMPAAVDEDLFFDEKPEERPLTSLVSAAMIVGINRSKDAEVLESAAHDAEKFYQNFPFARPDRTILLTDARGGRFREKKLPLDDATTLDQGQLPSSLKDDFPQVTSVTVEEKGDLWSFTAADKKYFIIYERDAHREGVLGLYLDNTSRATAKEKIHRRITRQMLLDQLREFGRYGLKESDIFLLYVSAHGRLIREKQEMRSSIVCYDGEVQWKDLEPILAKNLFPAKVVLILDICNAGAFRPSLLFKLDTKYTNELDAHKITPSLQREFTTRQEDLPLVTVEIVENSRVWILKKRDGDGIPLYRIELDGESLKVYRVKMSSRGYYRHWLSSREIPMILIGSTCKRSEAFEYGGGLFTSAMLDALRQVKASNPSSMTCEDFFFEIEETFKRKFRRYSEQIPVIKKFKIGLNLPLFER